MLRMSELTAWGREGGRGGGGELNGLIKPSAMKLAVIFGPKGFQPLCALTPWNPGYTLIPNAMTVFSSPTRLKYYKQFVCVCVWFPARTQNKLSATINSDRVIMSCHRNTPAAVSGSTHVKRVERSQHLLLAVCMWETQTAGNIHEVYCKCHMVGWKGPSVWCL